MILEGIVSTLDSTGTPNVAPMGPRLFPPFNLADGSRFELRPYPTAQTCSNLRTHPEGVLHVTDDVLLIAQAAVATVELPNHFAARRVTGVVLADACRAHEFRVVSIDPSGPRVCFLAEVVHSHHLRPFFGFNRAMHAVLEAAILATRTDFLPLGEIEADLRRLAIVVGKTGGPREQEAFAFLERHVARVKAHRVGSDCG